MSAFFHPPGGWTQLGAPWLRTLAKHQEGTDRWRGDPSGSHQLEMEGEVPAIGINSVELNRKWGFELCHKWGLKKQ